MDLPEHVTLAPEFAAYRPRGGRTAAEWREAQRRVLEWAARAGVRCLLADCTGITLLDPSTTHDLFPPGEGAAVGVKVAVVARAPRAEVFPDEVAALEWLVGPNAVRPVLETARLRLRWMVPADAPFILEITTQPSWMRNIGDRGVRDLETAEGYIRKGPLASYAARGYGLWCAVRREDGVPVGMCGIIKRDTMADPELAYAYLERFHGRGYGGEAALATMSYAREQLGLPRLAAIVNPANTASIRILERVGMTYRGPIQMPGDPAPIAHYTT